MRSAPDQLHYLQGFIDGWRDHQKNGDTDVLGSIELQIQYIKQCLSLGFKPVTVEKRLDWLEAGLQDLRHKLSEWIREMDSDHRIRIRARRDMKVGEAVFQSDIDSVTIENIGEPPHE